MVFNTHTGTQFVSVETRSVHSGLAFSTILNIYQSLRGAYRHMTIEGILPLEAHIVI